MSTQLASRRFRKQLQNEVVLEAKLSVENINFTFQDARDKTLLLADYFSAKQIWESSQQNDSEIIFLPQEIVDNSHYIDHIRYVNLNGQEVIRWNSLLGQGTLPLKNINERQYFQNSQYLEKNQVYVSSIELNREGDNAQLEIPYKSVARLITPVYNGSQKTGYVITNILLDPILRRSDQSLIENKYQAEFMMVNGDGYFLHHPNKSLEYGFERNQANLTFAKTVNNGAWEIIQDSSTGILDRVRIYGQLYLIYYQNPNLRVGVTTKRDKLIYLIPYKEAFAPIRTTNIILVALGIFTWAILMGVLFLIQRLILQREKSQQEREIERKSNQQKSKFLAAMSHELRTPLTGILGLSDLMLEEIKLENGKKKHQEFLQTIQTSGQYLLNLVNEILNLSKIQAGQISIEFHDFSLRQLLGEVIHSIEPNILDKDIEIIYRINPQLPKAFIGDSFRLRQVITNLLSNAIKFTSSGLILITIEEEKRDPLIKDLKLSHRVMDLEKRANANIPSLILLRFTIKDKGIGIPEDKLSNIFQPFIQVDSSVERNYGGTGLGLSITKELVELMGGEIGVKSELGKGTSFWFTLPLGQLNITLDEDELTAKSINKEKSEIFENARILLVEDNIVNQKVLKIILEKFGCQVTIAENGKQAINTLQENQYDLVLMDKNMPVMDGIVATAKIRMDSKFDDLPIVALSASSMDEEIRECLEVGMNDY
ncbi:hybrid sensor histidine kinase/response regulator, partial [Picosynechococcus sp. NKBG042902]|uniref:hybrid sensor histidine kinase/response regulator n=1 Tax=Picosynechococcus sp. NKBG042902 TaxID=490193 RepID=UPI001377D428